MRLLNVLMASMIVNDLDVPRTVVSPTEADPPLVIDSDAVLAASITAELLQAIAREHAKVIEVLGAVEHLQLSFGLRLGRSESFRDLAFEELLRGARRKRPNHLPRIV
jgi:hypothetical protein